MKKWCFFLTAFIATSLISCNKQEEAREYSLKSSDSLLRVKLDSLTSNLSSWLNYYHDEKLDSGMLFSVDPGQNEIELYSLTEGRLLDKVTYEREGPNGVGVLIEIGIQGLDSVLIFPAFDNSFYQSRFSDLALSKVEYEKPDEYAVIRSMTNYFGSNAYTDEDFIYTRTLFGGDYTLLDNEQLSAKPLMYRVNVANGEVEFSHFTFPDDYWADGKRHYEFSSVIDENRFTFSFHSDHHIYYGTSFQEPLKKKLAKSKYLSQELEYLPIAGDRNDRRRYFATAGHYGNLIYDQFRKVYYRFCYPKKQLEPDQDLQQMTLFPKEFSVMILNSELEVIGETRIGDGNHLYATSNVFVGPKGLYISVNHPESEMNREDTFGFQLFTLESVLK